MVCINKNSLKCKFLINELLFLPKSNHTLSKPEPKYNLEPIGRSV